MLVVGAPTAEASPSASVQYKSPGGVYYCPVSTDPSDCKRVGLDTIGKNGKVADGNSKTD